MSAAAALSTAMVDELIVRDELTPETPDIQMGGEDADASSLEQSRSRADLFGMWMPTPSSV